ncbi:hypothetical protein B0H13DRAFT_2319190 [Mycena leptocephala]|nr:hypothetical protein B0H13DRAFT_2319190 [Mycena leptocephala]
MASYDHNPHSLSPDEMSTPPLHAPESSVGSSHFSYGAPVDPGPTLQIPTLPMSAWSHMPAHLTAEEQMEVDDDPFANDDGNGSDVLSVEEGEQEQEEWEEEDKRDEQEERDELVDDSPIQRRTHKRPLDPRALIQPISYPPLPAEEQVGGGYPRREATPPKNPPVTRLRTKIVRPRRAV